MKNWLGIHLESNQPDSATPVSWVLYGGERLLAHGCDALGEVRNAGGPDAEKAEVHVFVPGTAVMLTEVNIPSRDAAHLRKALPFMIEEQLAGDLRQTHLAVAPQRHGDGVPVAVVSHGQMISWLEALHAANLSPVAVIPEQLLLPREPGSIFVHIHGDRALVRLGDCRGVVLELENLITILEVSVTHRAMPCSRIEISTCAGVVADEEQADVLGAAIAKRLDRPVRRTNYTESLVELLAFAARGPHAVLNLCQGGYRVDARGGETGTPWRITWIAAAASVLVFVLCCLVSGALMERQARNTHEEAIALFRSMFPDERRIVNLRRQAEGRITAAKSTSGGSLRGVAALAGTLGNAELDGISAQALRFDEDDGALSADLSAPSLSQIDRLGELLGAAGLGSRVLSASEESGLANARLELRTR